MSKLIVKLKNVKPIGKPFGYGKKRGNHRRRKKFIHFKGINVGIFQGNKYAAPLACRIWHRTILTKLLNNLQKEVQIYSTDIIGAALAMFNNANKTNKLKFLEKEICYKHKILSGV